MRKLLLGLGIAMLAATLFAQESNYVVYQGKMKGKCYEGSWGWVLNKGPSFVLVVDMNSDEAMIVNYGRGLEWGTPAPVTEPWIFSNIATIRQNGGAILSPKDEYKYYGESLSWFLTDGASNLLLVGQIKMKEELAFDWVTYFKTTTKWPKMFGAVIEADVNSSYGTVTASPLVALSREMNGGGQPAYALAVYIAGKNKMTVQEVKHEIDSTLFFSP